VTITDIRDTVVQGEPAYPVLSIDLFGSFVNGESKEDSDVDLLVCLDEKVASLFDLSGLKLDIQEKLHADIHIYLQVCRSPCSSLLKSIDLAIK
jgi:predicted nucleotidyltransferase